MTLLATQSASAKADPPASQERGEIVFRANFWKSVVSAITYIPTFVICASLFAFGLIRLKTEPSEPIDWVLLTVVGLLGLGAGMQLFVGARRHQHFSPYRIIRLSPEGLYVSARPEVSPIPLSAIRAIYHIRSTILLVADTRPYRKRKIAITIPNNYDASTLQIAQAIRACPEVVLDVAVGV